MFHLVLAEPAYQPLELQTEPFDSLIEIRQLGLEKLPSWVFKHSSIEACTAIKARAFEHIFDAWDAEKIVYLDPDIAVFNDLGNLDGLLDRAPIILVPHQAGINSRDEGFYHEANFLRCGVFNLGFLALRSEGQGALFLDWWRERTAEFCYDESPLGLFTDQRWCDLAPVFFDETCVLKDNGYNVSAWNLSQRKLSRDAEGVLWANDVPLRFFHFSRYGALDYASAARRYSADDPLVVELVDWYAGQLELNGESEYGGRTWYYDQFDNGTVITPKMRRYFREHPAMESHFPDPFGSGPGSFLHWWQQNDLGRRWQEAPYLAGYPASRACRVSNSDLENAYDKPTQIVRMLSRLPGSEASIAPEISIIVPVTGKPDLLFECLASLLEFGLPGKIEIIVVGRHSDLAAVDLGVSAGLKSIAIEGNPNTAQLCNVAALQAAGEFLVLLDHSARVKEGWLAYLKQTFADFPRTGLTGSLMANAFTGESVIGFEVKSDGKLCAIGPGRKANDPAIRFVREVEFTYGSVMVPKSIWLRVDGMNPRLDGLAALADLALRIETAGYEIRSQPASEVVSYEPDRAAAHELEFGRISPDLYDLLNVSALQRRLASPGNVLYIDDKFPQPDRSAGGVYSLNCLRILKAMGYDVTFCAVWEPTVDQRYIRKLQLIGVECLYRPFVLGLEQHLLEMAHRYDLVIICRAPVAHAYVPTIRNLAPQAKIIFNTIDLHFMRLERAARLTGNPEDENEARRIRQIELGIIEASDATMVCNAAERSLLRELAPSANVALVPIPVDIPGRTTDFEQRRDITFLGGYEHQPNVDAVKHFVTQIWPLISRRLPGVKFVVAGNRMPAEFSAFADDTVELRGYVADLRQLYESCRLSVVPLRFGAGVKGKMLASMSFGVPNVVTSLAAEGMGLTNGKEVLIADDPQEFAGAVERAYTEAALWQRLSDSGLEYLRNKASLTAVGADFRRMLSSLGLTTERQHAQ